MYMEVFQDVINLAKDYFVVCVSNECERGIITRIKNKKVIADIIWLNREDTLLIEVIFKANDKILNLIVNVID